ncbi:hypothetical protein ANN_00742 [Periplaneta americana]|uniref:Uncharacterized protein n=1 Tax=Periplaneta americana TaxID=6978 RepID=A0ABQ8TUW8_PERAM|nr:hypothetical protein ANN_00742 [Periplaneta americana]
MHVLKNENESDDEPESEVIDEPLVDHQHCQNLVTEQDSVNLPFTEATADELKTKINHDVESVYVKEESSLDCILESSKPEMTSNQREDLLTEYNAIQSACYKEGDADDIDRPSSETEITSGQEEEEEEEEEEEDPMSEHDAVESMSKNVLMDNTRKSESPSFTTIKNNQ